MHVIPQSSAGTPIEALSPREREVLHLVCCGLSNDDICDQLFVSINTVKTHIRSAYRKIRVETRVHAVIWGLSNGYGPTTSPPADLAVVAS